MTTCSLATVSREVVRRAVQLAAQHRHTRASTQPAAGLPLALLIAITLETE